MDFPCLFDESNINSIFGMLDPVNKGYISLEQYKEGNLFSSLLFSSLLFSSLLFSFLIIPAFTTLGVYDFDQRPPGHDVDKITPDIFMKEA